MLYIIHLGIFLFDASCDHCEQYDHHEPQQMFRRNRVAILYDIYHNENKQ